MGLFPALLRELVDSSYSQFIRRVAEGICETLCDSWGKLSAEEAGQEVWSRTIVAAEDAPTTVYEQERVGKSLEGGRVLVVEFHGGVCEGEEVESQGEGEASDEVEGASQPESVCPERGGGYSETERITSGDIAAGEEETVEEGAEPPVVASTADTETSEIPAAPSTTAEPAPSRSYQKTNDNSDESSAADILEEGLGSSDEFALPDSLEDIDLRPFEPDQIPSARGAAHPQIFPSLSRPPHAELSSQPASSPLAADPQLSPPLDQIVQLPDSEGLFIPPEIDVDLPRVAEGGDAESEAAEGAHSLQAYLEDIERRRLQQIISSPEHPPAQRYQEEYHLDAAPAALNHEGGIFSGDAFSPPNSSEGVFSGPFETDQIPSPRRAALPGTPTPLSKPDSPPLAADIERAPPVDQTIQLPDSEGLFVPAEIEGDLHRVAQALDAQTEAQLAPPLDQTVELPDSQGLFVPPEIDVDQHTVAQTHDAEPEPVESACASACEADALQQGQLLGVYQMLFEQAQQNLPSKYQALAQHLRYYPEFAISTKVEPLGEGGQGAVFKVEVNDFNAQPSIMALKVDYKGKVEDELYNEAINGIEYRGPRTISLQGFTLIEGRLGLLFEIAHRVWPSGVQSTPEQLRYIVERIIEICQGLAFLFGLGAIHCDLKPENIFGVNGQAKIGDLGYTVSLNSYRRVLQGGMGTPGYIAPEADRNQLCTVASDIFSLGTTAHSVATDTRPYQWYPGDLDALREHIAAGGRFWWPDELRASTYGRAFIDVVETCYHQDFLQRPNIKMAELAFTGVLHKILPFCQP